MLPGVSDPGGQLIARRHCSGRIIWETKVDQIDMCVGRLGHKAGGGRAGQINDSLVTAVGFDRTGMAGHHIGVYVDWINRIGNRDPVLMAEDIENVSAVTFRTVRDEYFVI